MKRVRAPYASDCTFEPSGKENDRNGTASPAANVAMFASQGVRDDEIPAFIESDGARVGDAAEVAAEDDPVRHAGWICATRDCEKGNNKHDAARPIPDELVMVHVHSVS